MRFPSVIAILACLAATGAAIAEPARTTYDHYDPAALCATARNLRQAGDEEGARILLARAKRLAPWHTCAERQATPAPSEPKSPSAPRAIPPEPPRPWPAK